MYRVLIVDDEPIVKVAMREIIDWEQCGFEICGGASSGGEALNYIEKFEPHLVITDLKMPGMDGIGLIQEINKRKYSCKILVISNFGEYDMVRQALTMGAVDYLLKLSMKRETLIEQLEKVKILIGQEDQAKQNESKHHRINAKLKKSTLQYYFNNPSVSLEEALNNEEINFYNYDKTCFLCSVFLEDNGVGKNNQVSIESVEHIFEEALESIEDCEIFIVSEQSVVGIIPILNQTKTQEVIKKIYRHLKTYILVPTIVLYSQLFQGYSISREKYKLCEAGKKIVFYENVEYLCAENIKFQELSQEISYKNIVRTITNKCQLGDEEGALEYLELQMKRFLENRIDPESVLLFIHQALQFEMLYNEELKLEEHMPKGVLSYIYELKTWKELNDFLKNQVILACQPQIKKKEISMAMKFMEENYSKKLSLPLIAEHVHLNESYLSRIFKEHTGTSITNFLNDVRMEKALNMIVKGDYAIKEIAVMVGVDNQFYFNRLFKKKFGMSPTQYLGR